MNVEDLVRNILYSALLVSVFICGTASAQGFASAEQQSIAVGHYARARALLVEALHEFEQGRQVAQPDLLIDADRWRDTVVSKTEELNRLLDPKPRVTRSGARYSAKKSLIRRDRVVSRTSGVQDSNTYGEKQRQSELYSDVSLPVKRAPMPEPSRAMMREQKVEKELESETQDLESKEVIAPEKAPPPEIAAAPAKAAEETESSEAAAADETDEVAQAIEAAIQKRLQKLRENEAETTQE